MNFSLWTGLCVAGLVGGGGVTWYCIEYNNQNSEVPNGWAYWTTVAGCGGLLLLGAVSEPCTRGHQQVAPHMH